MPSASVQIQRNKKTGENKHFVYIPKAIVEREKIKAGNVIDFSISNPDPEYIKPKGRGLNFQKKKENEDEEEKPELI